MSKFKINADEWEIKTEKKAAPEKKDAAPTSVKKEAAVVENMAVQKHIQTKNASSSAADTKKKALEKAPINPAEAKKENSYLPENWKTTSVNISGINVDFLRKMSKHLQKSQKDYFLELIQNEYELHRKELPDGEAMTFTSPKKQDRVISSDSMTLNIRLPKELMDFINDYADYLNVSKSTYVSSLLTSKMEEYLASIKG